MKVALYARVSSEAQQARGTIGSQLEVLRARVTAEGHELVGEFCDDGYSGARLNRPGLDALRDQAEAGAFDAVWCLSPDRLAVPTPIRYWSSMSSNSSAFASSSATHRRSKTTPRPVCSLRSKA